MARFVNDEGHWEVMISQNESMLNTFPVLRTYWKELVDFKKQEMGGLQISPRT